MSTQADQREDSILADRLISHSLAGPHHAEHHSAEPAPNSSHSLAATAAEHVADSQDPMGMGIIDARTCTLVR